MTAASDALQQHLCRTRGRLATSRRGWSTVTAVAVAAHRPDCVTRTCSPAGYRDNGMRNGSRNVALRGRAPPTSLACTVTGGAHQSLESPAPRAAVTSGHYPSAMQRVKTDVRHAADVDASYAARSTTAQPASASGRARSPRRRASGSLAVPSRTRPMIPWQIAASRNRAKAT